MNKLIFLLFFWGITLYARRNPFCFDMNEDIITLESANQSEKKSEEVFDNDWIIKAITDDVVILQDKEGNIREVKKVINK
jgi:aspartate carbamoyltransferase catalytic subunit